jgi:DNA repair protein RadC
MKVSSGGITGTIVDQRIVLGTALKAAATAIILAHNHPSGNLQPSQSDIDLTTRMKAAATFMDITIIDHLIVTDENYYSFADEGII